jgi:hypothetical protein
MAYTSQGTIHLLCWAPASQKPNVSWISLALGILLGSGRGIGFPQGAWVSPLRCLCLTQPLRQGPSSRPYVFWIHQGMW